MPVYKTPGVYIEEISTRPASVAGVATAIPAFIGYTEKAILNGATLAANTPTRITSMLEYEQIFGKAFDELFSVTLANPQDDPTITVNTPATLSPYLMHYQLQMYFGNGGGPCYIVSVGSYIASNPAPGNIVAADIIAGATALEKEDEPTMLIAPEAIHLATPGERRSVYDAILAQSAKLQDRVAIMDVVGNSSVSVQQDADDFRNNDVGPDNLKYGASYYPQLKTFLSKYYTDSSIVIDDNRTSPVLDNCTLNILKDGSANFIGKFTITNNSNIAADSFTVGANTLVEGTDFAAGAGNATTAAAIEAALNALADPLYTVSRQSNVIFITSVSIGPADPGIAISYTDSGSGVAAAVFPAGGTLEQVPANTQVYNDIKAELAKFGVDLHPSGALAGIYARVDRERGVWKAPANVGVRLVKEPNVLVTSEQQENLNVDATSGKSINVIRAFAGKGNLVWGARTLAGNDNEWRYVPVRRFFNFVEESVKKATEFVVFEPNDGKTWVRVKGMIENFLLKQWRDGALAGAKPEDAFFVKVGLGETMTSLDILEGRLIVEIGMAAVRPAEFIILKFSHKLQES